jgi:hypothetical protein
MPFATTQLAKLYGKKGYRQQSVLNRNIGAVNMGGANKKALAAGGFFNHFPEIAAAFPDALSAIVVETTNSLRDRASVKAPVGETGNLRDQWKVTFRHRSSDGNVVSGRIQSTAVNENGDEYGFYVEVGGVRGAAQPFLVPALQEERPAFVNRLLHLESRLPR